MIVCPEESCVKSDRILCDTVVMSVVMATDMATDMTGGVTAEGQRACGVEVIRGQISGDFHGIEVPHKGCAFPKLQESHQIDLDIGNLLREDPVGEFRR